MSNPYLLLWLEAPLQSWGHDSKFGRRDSLDFPTKSGVLGLICCALGAGGAQEQWLGRMAPLDMQVDAYSRRGQKRQSLARPPLLTDFHVIGGGYKENDGWENLLIPKKSDGKKPTNQGSKVTYRYYIQDMAYAVSLEVPSNEASEIFSALSNPVWDIYLGRKCCAPTEFIAQGIFPSIELALKKSQEIADYKERTRCFRVVQGAKDGEIISLNDVPLCFGVDKKYTDRRVTVCKDF